MTGYLHCIDWTLEPHERRYGHNGQSCNSGRQLKRQEVLDVVENSLCKPTRKGQNDKTSGTRVEVLAPSA